MKNVKKAYYAIVLIGIVTLATYVAMAKIMMKVWEINPALLGAIGTVSFAGYLVYKVAKKLTSVVVSHYQQKDL
jgi:hypothetical protein